MKKKNTLIILLSIVLVVGTFLIALINSKLLSKRQKSEIVNYYNQNTILDESIQSNANTVKVSPGAEIVFEKYYTKCGHTIKERENVNKQLVNLNIDEFKNKFKDWKINSFSNNKIELYKEFENECNEHYLVKSEDGIINIYNIEESGNLKLVEKTEIEIKYLSEDDIKSLEEGIVLVGKEELNSYIENFE